MDMKTKFDFNIFRNNRELKVLFFISKILFPQLPSHLYIIYTFIHFCKVCHQKRKYQLEAINDNSINGAPLKQYPIDENYTVIINTKLLKGNTDALLEVKYAEKLFQRNVKLQISDSVDKQKILVPQTLLFNILNNGKSIHYMHEELTACIKGLSCGKVGVAEEIHLALVSSPYELDNSSINLLVKNYFHHPKLIYENDIIEINLRKYSIDLPDCMNKVFNMDNRIHFKCTKLIKGQKNYFGKYAVLGETTIKQVANIQSFLPSCIEIKQLSFNVNDNKYCPNGLKDYATEIEAAVKPFLVKKLAMNPIFLITGKKGSGKEQIVSSIASKLGMNLYKITNFDITAHVYAQNETKLKNVFFNAKLYAPCILYMKNFEEYEKNNEGQTDERIISHFTSGLNALFENNAFPIILFCSSNNDKISARLKREFLEIFEIKPPTKEERIKMLQWLFQYNRINYMESLEEVAQKTNTFLFEDLNILIRLARTYQTTDILSPENLLHAIEYMQFHYNKNIGAPKVPKVQWDDIGGLNEIKDEIIKTINFPLKHPELINSTGLKRFGILLFGPPGTGKTLLAKAVATECNLCFLSVKGPELLNMYIGQSEENIREVFERARAASPCIIFFDELDSLAPNRGVSGDSGGVMDRVVSQLLAEMDGLNDKATVFIIGATNRPDLIDPALLRPGRFDKLLYVGPAMNFNSRLSVLTALTRKFNISEEVKLEDVVNMCPNNISGADFYGICAESWMHAARRTIEECENDLEDVNALTEKNVVVQTEDFEYALSSVKPSITKDDLLYFEKLKTEISSNR